MANKWNDPEYRSTYFREYNQRRKEERKRYMKKWLEKNLEKKRAKDREYAANHKSEAQYRAREWYKNNPEQAKASRKAWYEVNRNKISSDARERRKANPEKYQQYELNRRDARKTYMHEYYLALHPKKRRENINRLKEWMKAHPEKVKKNNLDRGHRRRARLNNAPTEQIDRDKIYERDKGVCGICHKRVTKNDFSIDHIVPIRHSGSHLYHNIQTAHISCNKTRRDRGQIQLRLDLYAESLKSK